MPEDIQPSLPQSRGQFLRKPHALGADGGINQAAGTLTVSDNGVGLSRERAVEDLGTIARSGTRAYLSALLEAGAEAKLPLTRRTGAQKKIHAENVARVAG